MLQQTQVKTVIPYYNRFIALFPTVEALAKADIDQVLKLWEGLGYYSRARNLHACAKQVVADFDSHFPKTIEQIISLPGIGESTGGAILSLAYGLPEAILDGNVKRVLARVFLVDGWYGKSNVNKQLWDLSRNVTPLERTGDFNQAMMDLGASLCSRSKPICSECPLSINCKAYQLDKTSEYPHKKPKKKIPTKSAKLMLSINSNHQILLEKRPPSGIWGGLWSLPEQRTIDKRTINAGEFKHSFSHYHLQAEVVKPITTSKKIIHQVADNNRYAWHNISDLDNLALPTPIRRFLANYINNLNV